MPKDTENIENKKSLTNSQVFKYGTFIFMGALAFARNEYNVKQIRSDLNSGLKEYIIANDYDKKIINMNFDNLKAQVDVNTQTIKLIADFIKPDDKNYNSFTPRRK